MVTPTAGEVVLVPFPFSDLSQSKVRPAVCLADAGRGDWVLCQITSSPYGDPAAIPLDAPDFASGGLLVASFARPGKLVYSPCWVDSPLGRRPQPGCDCAGAVRGCGDTPAARKPLTPNQPLQM